MKRQRLIGLLVCVLLVSCASRLAAAEKLDLGSGSQGDRSSLERGSLFGRNGTEGEFETPEVPWGRLVYGTTAVVGLICLGVYVLKKLGGGAAFGRGRYMDVLETRIIGRGMQLLLVRVAGRVVLLAASGETVTRVAEFKEEDLPAVQTEGEELEPDRFRNLLENLGVRKR
jgi:flagellar biogenesis protein FliO